MTVLVDTSIWIAFLSNKAPYAARVDELLEREEVTGHDLVYGELLIGDKGGRARFLDRYELLHWTPTVPHEQVVTFVRERRLHARGIGWIDAHLLASVLVARGNLWTADPRLADVARALGVAAPNCP